MDGGFYDISKLEQDFIDVTYIQRKTLFQCSEVLNVDISIVRQLFRANIIDTVVLNIFF